MLKSKKKILTSAQFKRIRPVNGKKKDKSFKKKGRSKRSDRDVDNVDSDEYSNPSTNKNVMDDNAFDEFDAGSAPELPPSKSQISPLGQSARNRKKFVDLRPGKKGASFDRLSTVNLVVEDGRQENARVSKVLKAFSSEISKDEQQEQRNLLSSANFKRTHNVPERPPETHTSPHRQTLIQAAKKLVAGNDYEALRHSTATMQTVRQSEVMKPAEVDFGLTETEIDRMNYDSLNSYAQNTETTKKMNEAFGTEILKKEVAVKYNKEKRIEAAKDKKRLEKKEARRKLFNKVNPFTKSFTSLKIKKSKSDQEKKPTDI